MNSNNPINSTLPIADCSQENNRSETIHVTFTDELPAYNLELFQVPEIKTDSIKYFDELPTYETQMSRTSNK